MDYKQMWDNEVQWLEWSCKCIEEMIEISADESEKSRLTAKLDGMQTALNHMKGTIRFYSERQ